MSQALLSPLARGHPENVLVGSEGMPFLAGEARRVLDRGHRCPSMGQSRYAEHHGHRFLDVITPGRPSPDAPHVTVGTATVGTVPHA